MNDKHSLYGACRLAATALMVVTLAACSALQIDVDVYKGPLVSDAEVQREQLIGMAMTAKPLLYTARNNLLDEVCKDWDKVNDNERRRQAHIGFDGLPCPDAVKPTKSDYGESETDKGRTAKRLNELVIYYDDFDASKHKQALDGRIREGIDSLASGYAQARDDALNAAGTEGPEAVKLKLKSRQAFARLDHAVVDLAARMQFLAGNSWLADETKDADGRLSTYKALLESIANSIVVVSDDLRARQAFDERQISSAEQEKRAVTAAFAVDAAGVIRDVERLLDSGAREALAREKPVSEGDNTAQLADAKKRKDDSQRDLEGKSTALDAARTAYRDWLDLAATGLGPATAVDVAPVMIVEEPGPPLADRKQMSTLLKTGTKNLTREALRIEVVDALKRLGARYTAPGQAGVPRGERLRAAVRALETLKPESGAPDEQPVSRKQAAAELNESIGEAARASFGKVQAASAAQQTAKAANKTAVDEVVRIEAAAKAPKKTYAFSSADYKAATVVVLRVKAEVVTKVNSSEPREVMGALRSAIAAAAAQPAKAGDQDLSRSVALLDSLAVPVRMGVADEAQRSIEVLDGVIAQLRYAVIESVRKNGAQHKETMNAQAALEAAQRQREDKIYIRPASAYLRAANPVTALQSDPSLRWRNMLLDQATQPVRSLWNQIVNRARKDAMETVRANIDKANWQNINSVRVNGAGQGNFVVVKDDVGNWYVKAMGSDASGMIKAAKNLALFNMSSTFDTNLLRVAELRDGVDNEQKSDKERDRMAAELKDLRGGKSGAGVAAQSNTLTLFKKNYDTQSADQLKALNARLRANDLITDVKGRWTTILKDSTAKDALDDVFESDDAAALHKAALASSTAPPAGAASTQPPDTPAGTAMIKTLRSLQGLRTTARASVKANAKLTSQEAAAVVAADKDVATAREEVDKINTQMDVAIGNLKTAEASADPAAKAAAMSQVSALQGPQKAARDKLVDLQKTQALTQAALLQSRKRQSDAADAVDTVFKAVIEAAVNERLRVVAETETAVKVIGGAVR